MAPLPAWPSAGALAKWNALALLNGVTPNGAPFEDPGYAVYGALVVLRGIVIAPAGGLAAGVVLFTLPAGARPAKTRRFFPNATAGGQRLDVAANGDVSSPDNTGAGGFIALDGVVVVLP